jgi:hypothetical protein
VVYELHVYLDDIQALNVETNNWKWVLESGLHKNRSATSIQWARTLSMNRTFQGKHLCAGGSVCILSVFCEGSWLARHRMLWRKLLIHCFFLRFVTIQLCVWFLIFHWNLVLPAAVCPYQPAHHLICPSCTWRIEVAVSTQTPVTPMGPLSGLSQWTPKSSQTVCTCTGALFYLTAIICHCLPLVCFACMWLAVLTGKLTVLPEVFCFFLSCS